MRRIVTVSMVVLLLAGCGGSKRVKHGVVSGKVTYKGQAVNDAALVLYPVGAAPETVPVTLPVSHEGEYSTSPETPTGEYKVIVEGSKGTSQVPPELLKRMTKEKQAEMKAKLDPMSTPPTIRFPDKYKDVNKTTLRLTVTDKDQTLDLTLTD
jgi:hypothetical protein